MLECTDARDHLYALLSIDPTYAIPPEYSLSINEVYMRLAELLITRRLALQALLFAKVTVARWPRDDLPSLVLRFAVLPVSQG